MSRKVLLATQVLLVLALIAAYGSSNAHHSRAGFYEDKGSRVTLTGVVKKFRFINPHCYLAVDVTDESGEVTTWVIEMSDPGSMRKMGWRHDSLTAGDVVTFKTNPAKDGRPRGDNAYELTLPDGTVLKPTTVRPQTEE